MKPIRTQVTTMLFKGAPGSVVGNLPCHHGRDGEICSVWELDDADRSRIAQGGNIVLGVWAVGVPPMYVEIVPPESAPELDTEPITAEVLRDLLLLVGVYAEVEVLESWTDEQRARVEEWAVMVHLDASDNDVQVPEKPAEVLALEERPVEES